MQSIVHPTSRGRVTLREGSPADAVPFRELRLLALQDAPTAFSADYEVHVNRPLSYWENRLRADEHTTIFLAEQGGRLIGMTGIYRRESLKTRHSAEILSVFVHPEWRGLHIAKALIEACADWAKARQVKLLKLGVNASNTAAVRCYERCGFKIYGTEPGDIFYEDQYYDLHLMYRELT